MCHTTLSLFRKQTPVATTGEGHRTGERVGCNEGICRYEDECLDEWCVMLRLVEGQPSARQAIAASICPLTSRSERATFGGAVSSVSNSVVRYLGRGAPNKAVRPIWYNGMMEG